MDMVSPVLNLQSSILGELVGIIGKVFFLLIEEIKYPIITPTIIVDAQISSWSLFFFASICNLSAKFREPIVTTSSIISLMESEKDLKNINEYFQIMTKMLFILENKIFVSFFVVFNISVLIIVKSEPYSYGKVLFKPSSSIF
ncbi:EC1118_1B15_2014p [Saccharomyces cerevisiae EC1118]|uniref:EC1118_1B15_2014p n=1 Tax=Saccharomyces cerevisiae (strain Lalvin EC1118 / Prise de mousse) TaxID=643680 RepID=D3UEG1_YEAS8|nr:EC1118_1B15_2014p [Saccharomyces cerevisiae EC1118]